MRAIQGRKHCPIAGWHQARQLAHLPCRGSTQADGRSSTGQLRGRSRLAEHLLSPARARIAGIAVSGCRRRPGAHRSRMGLVVATTSELTPLGSIATDLPERRRDFDRRAAVRCPYPRRRPIVKKLLLAAATTVAFTGGASAIPAANPAVGPSYNCMAPAVQKQPLAQLICASPAV